MDVANVVPNLKITFCNCVCCTRAHQLLFEVVLSVTNSTFGHVDNDYSLCSGVLNAQSVGSARRDDQLNRGVVPTIQSKDWGSVASEGMVSPENKLFFFFSNIRDI